LPFGGSVCLNMTNFMPIGQTATCRKMAVFRFFKMAAVHNFGFVTVRNFNSRYISERQLASPYQISCRCGDMAAYRLFKITAVRHLGFVIHPFGSHVKSIWWFLSVCHCAKFGWNRCSSSCVMQILIFCALGLN